MRILPARTAALLTAAATGLALLGTGLATPASADTPGALTSITSGEIGGYVYDVQWGPGTDDDGKPALCSRSITGHTAFGPPNESVRCVTKDRKKVVAKGRVLDLDGPWTSYAEYEPSNITVFATAPKVQRLKVKITGSPWVTLRTGTSKDLTIDGERMRFFYLVELNDDPGYTTKVKGQRKACKKVRLGNGKTKRRCGWQTVADKRVYLES